MAGMNPLNTTASHFHHYGLANLVEPFKCTSNGHYGNDKIIEILHLQQVATLASCGFCIVGPCKVVSTQGIFGC